MISHEPMHLSEHVEHIPDNSDISFGVRSFVFVNAFDNFLL